MSNEELKNIRIIQSKIDQMISTQNKIIYVNKKDYHKDHMTGELEHLDFKIKHLQNRMNQNISSKRNTKNDEKNIIPKEIKLKTKEWEKFEKSHLRFENNIYQTEKRIFSSEDEKSDFYKSDKDEDLFNYRNQGETDSSGESLENSIHYNKKFSYNMLKDVLYGVAKSNEIKGIFRIESITFLNFLQN